MNTIKDVKYGLLLNGKLVKCRRSDNSNSDYCVDETVKLDKYAYEDWLVEDMDTVMKVLNPNYVNPGWYNADINNPIVEVDLSNAQPVQITTSVEYTTLRKD